MIEAYSDARGAPPGTAAQIWMYGFRTSTFRGVYIPTY